MRVLRSVLIVPVLAALLIGGCAPSPLYVDEGSGVTPGPVPRDANGNPVLPSAPKPRER